jgi:hypothetical protein
MPLVFHQAPEACDGFVIIIQLQFITRKTWLHIV